MSDLWRDIRVASRGLARPPGFVLATALTLGLGVGANTAVFSFVNALMLRPFPFPEPDRLAAIEEERQQAVPSLLAAPGDYTEWSAGNSAFEQLAAYQYRDCNVGAPATGAGEGEHASTCDWVRCRYWLGWSCTAGE